MAVVLNPSSSRSVRNALLVCLAIAVVVTYSNTFAVPYLLDDFVTIPNNPSLRDLGRLSDVFFPPPHIYSAGRPILNLSFALNYAIGGTAVGGYHLVNLAIHLAATFVLYGAVRLSLSLPRFASRIGDAAPALALSVAALWSLHPLQTTSVTYISQRAESLMALFYLLTFFSFARAVTSGNRGWLALSVFAAACGMATKEVMATAPLVVFLFDSLAVAGTFRDAWSQRSRYYIALAATWLIVAGLMITAGLSQRSIGGEQGIGWIEYVRLECRAVVLYLQRAFFPYPLVFDYGPNFPRPSWLALLLPGTVLLGLITFSVRKLLRGQIAAFLSCSFLLFLAPTSSIIPIAGQPIAENRVYLPLAFVITGIVVGAYIFARRSVAFWAVAAAALGVVAHARNEQFRTDVRIWRDTVTKQPINSRAWVYLVEALKSEGRMAEAVEANTTALRYLPDVAELHNNFGVLLYTVGRPTDALTHLETAVRLKPGYVEAYYNFGAVLFTTGNIARALECFLTYLKFNPASVEAQNYAGLCLVRQNQFAAAVPFFERAVQLDPTHAAARANLASALARAKSVPAP